MNEDQANLDNPSVPPSEALSRYAPPRHAAKVMGTSVRMETRYGFKIGNVGILIERNMVSEVVGELPVYPIPNTPAWLLGLINLRGHLVPTFDLRRLFGVEGNKGIERKLLVLDRGESAVATPIEDLPRPLVLDRPLDGLPPLPQALKGHVTRGYMQNGQVWAEIDQKSFFQALAR